MKRLVFKKRAKKREPVRPGLGLRVLFRGNRECRAAYALRIISTWYRMMRLRQKIKK